MKAFPGGAPKTPQKFPYAKNFADRRRTSHAPSSAWTGASQSVRPLRDLPPVRLWLRNLLSGPPPGVSGLVGGGIRGEALKLNAFNSIAISFEHVQLPIRAPRNTQSREVP